LFWGVKAAFERRKTVLVSRLKGFYSVLEFNTPPTLPYRVGQAAKRQAKQLDAVLWRGGSFFV
jgi:hypothetical protein